MSGLRVQSVNWSSAEGSKINARLYLFYPVKHRRSAGLSPATIFAPLLKAVIFRQQYHLPILGAASLSQEATSSNPLSPTDREIKRTFRHTIC